MKQYTPLYLKYRPQKLSALVGQEVVKKTLTNAISYNKIVHAYLFCGPRGTGKTSTARILAKSLNCEKGITTEPCDKCVSCESIIKGNSLDVIEIDAASHRKVEDAEDLINRVNLGTFGSRYKIYIIDEVHMLTDHAFNALLKTIEEPPKNVIFILATTENYKVIPTIVSRCQRLDFKPIAQEELERKIKDISKSEEINIDSTIISFVSRSANGCLRDAISLLDQISVLQNENKPISSQEVFNLFGTIDRIELFKLIKAFLIFNNKDTVEIAESFIKSGKEISELYKALIRLVIDLAKAQIDSAYKKLLGIELQDDLKVLDVLKKQHLLKVINRLHDSQARLRFALSQELEFMVNVMSMLSEDFLVSVDELKGRIERLEQSAEVKESRSTEVLESKQTKESPYPPSPQPIQQFTNNNDQDATWTRIVSHVESNPTKTLLNQSGCYLLSLSEKAIEIGLSKDMFLPRLEKDTKKKEMILHATKIACGFEPEVIKFKFLPRQSEMIKTPNFSEHHEQPSNDDDFTKAIKDLLGAKQIE